MGINKRRLTKEEKDKEVDNAFFNLFCTYPKRKRPTSVAIKINKPTRQKA